MISQRVKPKFLWFRISIAFGVLLGLLLLAQTLATYHYVSRNLVRQEAGREADRRMQAIARAARQTGSDELAKLTPTLNELVRESPEQLAWIRILGSDGKMVAATDTASMAPTYKPGEIGKMMGNRNRVPAEMDSPSGTVVVVLSPMRFGPPPFARGPAEAVPQAPSAASPTEQPPVAPAPGAEAAGRGETEARGGRNGRVVGRGRRPPEIAEIGIYLGGVSTHFGPLQQNLVVGCAASLALLGSMIIIGLRFRAYMLGRHIEEELSVARRVQLDLFPHENSIATNLEFAARCVPAYQVGGDLYDVFDADNGEVAMVLGDVSGKGLPAALLMGVVQGAVRASVGTGAASNHEQAAERLNHLLCMKTARERFVSLFWCYFHRGSGSLRYINAGHLPPLLVRRDGEGSCVIRLDEGGPVLGLLPGARYQQAMVQVKPGDLLIVFSDGILEAANSKDEEFGELGITDSVERNWHQPPSEMCASLLEDVRKFLGGCLPQDDQTLLVVRLDPAAVINEPASLAAALRR